MSTGATPSREFTKLICASFISQVGSHFLTIATAAYIFSITGSPVKATAVFVFTYLPSAIFSQWLGAWIDRRISRAVLIGNDLLAILTTLAIGWVIAKGSSLILLAPILSVRSVLLLASRSSGIRWIKEITIPSEQARRLKLFFFTFFCSTAVAGVLAGGILARFSIIGAVLVGVATYAASISVVSSLKPIQVRPIASAGEKPRQLSRSTSCVSELLQNSHLGAAFLGVVLSQAFFQGAFSVLVTYLPLKAHGLGPAGVSYFQLAASVGITLGFLALWIWPGLLTRSRKRVLSALLLGAIGWLASTGASELWLAVLAFFFLNFGYELIWLHYSSIFFEHMPSERGAEFQFFLAASASFLMSLVALLYAQALHTIGAEGAIGVMVLLAGLIGLALLACQKLAPGLGRRKLPAAGAGI